MTAHHHIFLCTHIGPVCVCHYISNERGSLIFIAIICTLARGPFAKVGGGGLVRGATLVGGAGRGGAEDFLLAGKGAGGLRSEVQYK